MHKIFECSLKLHKAQPPPENIYTRSPVQFIKFAIMFMLHLTHLLTLCRRGLLVLESKLRKLWSTAAETHTRGPDDVESDSQLTLSRVVSSIINTNSSEYTLQYLQMLPSQIVFFFNYVREMITVHSTANNHMLKLCSIFHMTNFCFVLYIIYGHINVEMF